MKVFITGGTGFLGQRVIHRLSKDDYSILALARSQSSLVQLGDLGVSPVLGSLENIDQWQDLLSSVDIIIHCAAPVEFWGKWEKYQKGIVDPTKALFEAAERHGVKRFIYISSESVLQDTKDLVDVDETEPYPTRPNSNYGFSKMLAESYILSRSSAMQSVIIRPTFIWGVGVAALSSLVEKVRTNKFMWINNGSSLFEMVHVDNVAESIALACISGKDKNIYIVTDDNAQPVRQFLSKLLATQGVSLPDKSIPKAVAVFMASFVEWVWRIFDIKKNPPISKFDLAFISMARKYNIGKIKNDLGYRPVISEQQGLEQLKNTE